MCLVAKDNRGEWIMQHRFHRCPKLQILMKLKKIWRFSSNTERHKKVRFVGKFNLKFPNKSIEIGIQILSKRQSIF